MRHFTTALVTIFLSGGAAAQTPSLPPAPVKPVTETYFGTTITDPYRYMENLDDPAVVGWIKAQGAYTRNVLDSVPGHAALLSSLTRFTGGFDLVNSATRAGDRLLYEEQAPGSDTFDLVVRDPDGRTRKLVDVAAWRAKHGGKPYAINYFLASPDGSKVAVGLSEGGSELASMSVYDVASGRVIAGPIPRVRFGATGWTSDSRKVFFNQLANLPANAPATDTYKNSRALVWDLKSAPVPLLGGATRSTAKVPAEAFPYVSTVEGSHYLVAVIANGVQNELTVYTAPVSDLPKGSRIAWRRLVSPADGITGLSGRGDELFLLSKKGAPTFQVLGVNAGQPLSAAKTIVPSSKDRLIEGVSAAADALYVQARSGVYSQLLRVPFGGGEAQALSLPFKGSIAELDAEPTKPGVVVTMASWTHPQKLFLYSPATGQFTDEKLAGAPASFDPSQFVTRDLMATAGDGTAVPLSFITKAGASRPGPVLLDAYGSYGISQYPGFGTRTAYTLTQGIGFGVCHVRGGGELGDEWRLAGKDANKPNTWRDLIACANYLVKQGYTTPAQLFIIGGSAGGITMGRAMEERPDLFAGVIDEVPAANAVRQEFSPNGVPNIPEFGTVKTEQGFRNLYEMDSYLHVENGRNYPAVLITTGLNDPRVASWEPAKLAARLQASGTKQPVLLRVDADAGHGIGSTKTQNDELYADILTFIRWRLGTPGWAPAVAH